MPGSNIEESVWQIHIQSSAINQSAVFRDLLKANLGCSHTFTARTFGPLTAALTALQVCKTCINKNYVETSGLQLPGALRLFV